MEPTTPIRGRSTGKGPWLMVGLAALLGIPSGIIAVFLRSGVHWVFESLEAVRAQAWGLFLPALGAFVSVWIVRRLFQEPGGHGVPAVLEAVSREGGYMRRRSIVSRLFGSLINVSSGGSAGLEGPIVFSAAALGSNLGRMFGLAERQRSLLLACGVAGGIGAIFNAPLTGLIFASEVVLAEWSLGSIIPVAVSATVATELGRQVLGGTGAFSQPDFIFSTSDLVACAALGALAGGFAVLLVRFIHGLEHDALGLRRISILRRFAAVPVLGGLVVGVVGLIAPGAIGEGYDTVNLALQNQLAGSFSILLLLLVGKFIATGWTLGTGTPGGIFAPSLVMGALLGTTFGRVLKTLLPNLGLADPGFYALVAMAGFVAGTMQAPFTGIFLVLETTGGWELTLPLILVSVVSALVARNLQTHSFYTQELMEAGRLLRPGTDRRILADLNVGEMIDVEACSITAGSSLEDLTKVLPGTRRNHFAVVDPKTRAVLGMLDIASLRPFIFDEHLRRATPVDTVMERTAVLDHQATLLQAMDAFEQQQAWVLPVVKDGEFFGFLSKSTLFDRYRRELIIQTSSRD